MLFNETTFIGIDPTAGKRPMAYAALDRDLNPLALGEGDLDAVMPLILSYFPIFQSLYGSLSRVPK